MLLPVMSPLRSIICKLTPAAFSLASTSSASRAERNMRSSLAVIITAPGFRMPSSAVSWSRLPSRTEPETPVSTNVCVTSRPCIMA